MHRQTSVLVAAFLANIQTAIQLYSSAIFGYPCDLS